MRAAREDKTSNERMGERESHAAMLILDKGLKRESRFFPRESKRVCIQKVVLGVAECCSCEGVSGRDE